MCFAMDRIRDIVLCPELRFNSLFVGMCFAMLLRRPCHREVLWFQFPFRRDVLCNDGAHPYDPNALRKRFNSLFVGMCFAMIFG